VRVLQEQKIVLLARLNDLLLKLLLQEKRRFVSNAAEPSNF
jgi:hypothetical protein